MRVDLKLYQTKIDEENLFVGTSAEDRETSLNSVRINTTLTNMPYNPNDPFRLKGNFLEYQRKYNYCKFTYYINSADEDTSVIKYFFIKDFVYVSDDTCRMIADEDVLSNIFWKLKFSRFLPSKCTYNSRNLIPKDRKYKAIETGGLFKKTSEYNLLLENSGYGLGFVIFSCLCDGFQSYWDKDSDVYFEDGQRYPFFNIVLPFLYDTDTKNIIDASDGQLDFYFKDSSGVNYKLLDTSDFQDFASLTLPGFSIISSIITTNLKSLVKFSKSGINVYIEEEQESYKFKVQPATQDTPAPHDNDGLLTILSGGNTSVPFFNYFAYRFI